MMRNFAEWLARKTAENSNFNSSQLRAEFVPYFENGKRVKVEAYGEVKTGTVGVSTGFVPVFLLMRNSRCCGSSDLLDHSAHLIGVQDRPGGKYRTVSA